MRVGEVIAGRFELTGVAGQGGVGTVYRARDREREGAPIALKVLRARGQASNERFLREMRVLAELEHPGIVRYLAHGRTPAGELYLAMEWIEGGNLRSRLAGTRLTVNESIRLAQQAASALGAAHRRGIVHRDIKPANLMLVGGDVDALKVVDFGLVSIGQSERLTQEGAVLGTPGYMAPEQARGSGAVGPPADVFALGCVLFECLAGQAPFASDRIDQLIYEEAPRLEALCPAVPAALAALVASMLAKDPGQRPADGTAMVEELAALCERTEAGADAQRAHRPALTRSEQRYVSVIAIRLDPARTLEPQALAAAASALLSLAGEPPETWSESRGAGAMPPGGNEDTPPEQEISRGLALEQQLQLIATPFGAQVESLGEGAFVALMLGQGVATDQMVRSGRCALALRGALPEAQLVLATGRCVLGSRLPLGEVLDRAMALLELPAESGDIRLDAIAAGLLDAAFEVGEDSAGPRLRGERKGNRARTLLGKRTTCVGRERELAMLAGLYEECVSESVARAVLVTAPAGLGKSRLRYELLEQLGRHREPPLVLMASGDPMQSGSPLLLLRQMLRQAAGLGEVAREERYERLRAWLGMRLNRAELEQVGEFLAEMAGAPPPVPGPFLVTARRDPTLMGEQLRRALSCWLRAECAMHPVVLALEDLQWGDLPSIKLVDVALGALGDQRLFVMGFGRPEVHELFPGLWVGRTLQEIHLGPLTRKASESLVRQVLGLTVNQGTMAAVIDLAAGHAFYLEELIRAVAEGRTGALPETVLAMAQARLDALGSEDRRLLRAASIFGGRFTGKELSALLGLVAQAAEIDSRLGELAERELLTCDIQGGGRTFAFRHALLREGTYSTLTDEDRRLGHLLAAEWLERSGERDALPVAQHFERGGHPERAVGWYLQAARQALTANDYPATITRAERGVRCGATGERLGELCLAAGKAHVACGEEPVAERYCRQALGLLPRGSPRWYEAASVIITSETLQGLMPEIILEMTRFEPQGPITQDEGEMTGLVLLALGMLGMPEQVHQFVARLECRAHLLAPGDPAAGWLDFARAIHALLLDGAESAMQLLKVAAVAFDRAGDLRALVLARWASSNILFTLREVAECEQMARLALATAERLGLRTIKGMAQGTLGWAMAAQGEVEAGCALLRDALAVDLSPSNHWGLSIAHAQLADALLQAGHLEEAEREAQASLAQALVPGGQVTAWVVLGEAQLRGGHAAEARGTARKALAQIAERNQPSPLVWETHHLLAQALEACGDLAGAREAAVRARDCLLALASKFQDPEARQRLLQANHQVLELAERWIGAAPAEVSPG